MKNLEFKIQIHASASKVWHVLWSDITYRQWTAPFSPGSHAVTDWKEGSKVLFLGPEGSGMFSKIETYKTFEYMAFKHLGEVKNFEEQPVTDAIKDWVGAMETYRLEENNGVTALTATTDMPEEFVESMGEAFKKAMDLVKSLSENPVVLTVTTAVNASAEKTWGHFTQPEHIMQWNNASDDWHCPAASSDLRPGGNFSYTMAAKDGSFSFDFGGVFDEVKPFQKLTYTIADGRKVEVTFLEENGSCTVTEKFEAESMNSYDLQIGGWQAILNNFKKQVEGSEGRM